MSIPYNEEERNRLIEKHGLITIEGLRSDKAQAKEYLSMTDKESSHYEWEVMRKLNEDGVRYSEQNPGECNGYNRLFAKETLSE